MFKFHGVAVTCGGPEALVSWTYEDGAVYRGGLHLELATFQQYDQDEFAELLDCIE